MTHTLTHDVHINGRYALSLYDATPAQVRGVIFEMACDISEDVVVYHADGTVADRADNYQDGDDGIEIDYHYHGGDKYPDPADSIVFESKEDDVDITDLLPEEDFDGDLVEHFYGLFSGRSQPSTPADYR